MGNAESRKARRAQRRARPQQVVAPGFGQDPHVQLREKKPTERVFFEVPAGPGRRASTINLSDFDAVQAEIDRLREAGDAESLQLAANMVQFQWWNLPVPDAPAVRKEIRSMSKKEQVRQCCGPSHFPLCC